MSDYTHPLDTKFTSDSVPVGTQCLIFCEDFNQIIYPGYIPPTVTHIILTFAKNFNMKFLPGSIPHGVTHLQLGYGYNQEFSPDCLPQTLIHLELGYEYNKPLLPGIIPSTVTHLELGYKFNKELVPGSIPHNVNHLSISHDYNHKIMPDCIPPSVTHIVCGAHIFRLGTTDIILPNITHCEYISNSSALSNTDCQNIHTPNLVQLYTSDNDNIPLSSLPIPTTVKRLSLGFTFDQSWESDTLPQHLTHIRFGYDFSKPITRSMLPLTVTNLYFWDSYVAEIDDCIISDPNISIHFYGVNNNISKHKKFYLFCYPGDEIDVSEIDQQKYLIHNKIYDWSFGFEIIKQQIVQSIA